ncbi:pilus assembly protein [Alteraurantiacibacter buctensis]|uniref:Putative Flp pilus-assembly TadG-like N-terminal domain-containing protein n=1 Tax=Alteraurantiacibacter buctensis TaxID=1503981 RepID=A0A844Z291_9SPHN|nr:pilus assembly protein TadG-related protein [Alteraurantiacibacter buctensis]MXO73346.1 hypothetical protein [Alteraurantiacibacter buctensis]
MITPAITRRPPCRATALRLLRALLARLARDARGNVMVLAAVALVPLVIVIGSAIDVSRYQMAQTRLQNACDSGALAARKLMTNDTMTTAARNQGLAFFDHNFPAGTFGTTNLTRDYGATSNGEVGGTASARLPTTIMQMFGFARFDLAVDCTAEVNISNTDIVFVLDVTGSMNCPDDGAFCPNGNNNNTEAGNARIRGLRTAVMSFYDTVEAATSSAAQVRYGVVPYSSGINVGRSIPAQYMATSAAYQTRVPQYTTSTSTVSVTVNSLSNRGTKTYHSYWYNPTGESSVSSQTACNSKAASSPLATTDVYVDNTIQANTVTVVSESWNGDLRTRVITARATFQEGVPTAWWNSNWNPRCFIDLTYNRYPADMNATIVERVSNTFASWNYQQATWNVGAMVTNGAVTLPTGASGANQVHTWDGCIEEAGTTTSTSLNPLPATAYDLDINLVPASTAQKWKPTLPGAVYLRYSGYNATQATVNTTGNFGLAPYYCPKAATRLTDYDRTGLENYLSHANGFRALGSTYHDIGMLWGARFLSPNGLFAADNATAPNGDAISRHIVFMTDGELSTSDTVYTPYGIHWWDRRVTTGTAFADVQAAHEARFQAICRQAREENISVWVVAFGTTLTQSLIDCATPGRAFAASNSAGLQTAFTQIAEKIAALRLTS